MPLRPHRQSAPSDHAARHEREHQPTASSQGTESCVSGPQKQSFEQINNSTGAVQCLHHDQQGSTRLLTGASGNVDGSYTYTPYGALWEHTGTATTPLGYDAQYTSSDTGLIYMRARTYDPATAQFLTVDPIDPITRAPYTYAGDSPPNTGDPTGLFELGGGWSSEGSLGAPVGVSGGGSVLGTPGSARPRDRLGRQGPVRLGAG